MTDLKPGLARLARSLIETPPVRSLEVRDAVLTFGDWQRLPDTVRHAFSVGGHTAVLEIPPATLDRILSPLGINRPLDEAQRGMLLELACLDLLDAVEADLGAVHPAAADDPAVAFGISIDDLPLSLRLSPPLAKALDALLDQSAAAPELPDAAQMTVPVTLRLGQQFLTASEAAELAIGDVIMLEPGPAQLMAEGFAAAVELSDTGARVRSELMPLPASPRRSAVHVCFESAQDEMTLGALNDLAPGTMLPIAAFADAALDLVIGGRIAGRGALVTLGTGAGVRILHLFDPKA